MATYLELLKKRRDNVDQMISMHSKKRDELMGLARILDSVCIVASIIVCGVTFFNYENYGWGDTLHLAVAFVSILLVAASLLNSFSNFKVKADKHAQAANRFASVKKTIDAELSCEELLTTGDESHCEVLKKIDAEIAAIAEISVISEKDFNRLKHYHRKKEKYRSMVGDYDSDSYLIARLKMRSRLRKETKEKKEGDEDDP